ncbi:MAG TPA: hypothetical protein VFD63_20125 [Pyrinomonadaceae bacterium]|nr:hypothetical protein [Pyrinomonadaceae bacterium]
MSTINRRDYLLQLGAGAAGFIAASELTLFAQTRRRPSNRRQAQSGDKADAETVSLKWPITHVEPKPDAFVTAVYVGLAGFAYNDSQFENRFVDVVFHPGTGSHKLEIQIYKNPPENLQNCLPDRCIDPGRNDRFRLVDSGPQGATPNVFEVDSKPFDRNSDDSTYKYDFRWMPDLHTPDFYPEPYGLNRVRGTRLAVFTGTFYTRVRTSTTFWRVNAEQCQDDLIDDYGHIALYMATAIDSQNDVALMLNQDSEPVYKFERGNKYQIVFNNECERCPEPDPTGCETKRNDFHFLRDVIKVPILGRLKYGLKVKKPCSGEGCAKPDFCLYRHGQHRATDEAPCSGAGYGKAPGFP